MHIVKTAFGVCLKAEIEGKEISIAFDGRDSDEKFFSPDDMRIFKGEEELTKEITGSSYYPVSNLSDVLEVIEKL